MTAQRIDGSVIRQNVAHEPAPSVRAACSCSSPISRSVGTTSRATNGSETKIVASTIDGSAKSTGRPWWESGPPNQPARPYRRKSASPTTTGESASGRSMNALSRPLPGKSRRTIAIAHTIPKTVFTGTAIRVMISVSLKAWSVSGELSASHAGWSPSSNVRQKTSARGATRMPTRYPTAVSRRAYLRMVVPRRVVADDADRQEHAERDHEQDDRHRG